LGFPSVAFNIQFGVVGVVLTVAEHVACSDVSLEAFEVYRVLIFTVEGDAEAESESEGVQDLWRDRGGVRAKVVYFQVGGFGVEGSGVEIRKKKLV
jgi:hypothetical protein